ncbi:MAG: helix-turn-helix transcriptional regulator [Bacteroidota bacterium]
MSSIPDLEFRAKPGHVPGFELMSLKKLFSEDHAPLDHDPFQAHRLSFFAFMLLQEGSRRHKVDFREYQLEQGDCLMISKNQIHAFCPEQSGEGYLVLFTEAFLLKYFSPSSLAKITRLYNYHLTSALYHNPTENQRLIKALQAELLASSSPAQADIVAAILSIYLLKLEQKNPAADRDFDRNYETFNAFRKLVEKGYGQSRNARDYADQLAISYKHLNEVCKKLTQKTAKAFIDDHVILEIKRQLAATTLSPKEICFLAGFNEPTNFVKYFKKHTGLTPAGFRKI